MLDECWVSDRWKPKANGYVMVSIRGKVSPLHKIAWESVNGSVPPGLELDHLCRNRACHRPSHLEAVTHAENVRRGLLSALRPNLCKRGLHSLDDAYVAPDGKRTCRQCQRDKRPVRTPQEVCGRGHDLADAYITPAGRRQCRQCQRERNRRYMKTYRKPAEQVTA